MCNNYLFYRCYPERRMANDGEPGLFAAKEVVRAVKEIFGMPPNDITDLVNLWVKDQRISNYGNSRKGVLWSILNDAGLYSKSRQNWCRRVY